MKKRIYSAIAIVAILALLFVLKVYVSDYFFDAFFAILACIASFEMSRLLTKIGFYNYKFVAIGFPTLLLASNLIGIHYASVGQDNSIMWLLWAILIDIACIVAMFLGMFLYALIAKKRTMNEMVVRDVNMSIFKFAFKKAINTVICFVYPAFLFMFFNFVNHMENLPFAKFEGLSCNISVFVLLTAFLIPMITDTFAMFMGMLIGGKKLAPKVSPNKTISGSVGGILWCVLFGACIYLIFGCIESFAPFVETFPIWAYLIIVFLGSIIAQGGDLCESVIKRRAGVSDSGNLIPGHGGLLDRIDSYIFMAPYIMLAFLIFAI